jgi:hypothetical protein
MSPPTITETRPSGHQVGERVELARCTISAGERVIYGQRVDGMVRFLPRESVVLVAQQGLSEDDACRFRGIPGEPARPNAARRKRPKRVSRAHLIDTGGAS